MLTTETVKIGLDWPATDLGVGHSLEQASNADIVIIDARSLKRVSVKLLEAFVKIKKAMLCKDGRFGIVRLVVSSPLIKQTLGVTGLSKLFEIHTTLETAGATEAKRKPEAPARVAA
jgi:anti-anti-sigma regulatory factor